MKSLDGDYGKIPQLRIRETLEKVGGVECPCCRNRIPFSFEPEEIVSVLDSFTPGEASTLEMPVGHDNCDFKLCIILSADGTVVVDTTVDTSLRDFVNVVEAAAEPTSDFEVEVDIGGGEDDGGPQTRDSAEPSVVIEPQAPEAEHDDEAWFNKGSAASLATEEADGDDDFEVHEVALPPTPPDRHDAVTGPMAAVPGIQDPTACIRCTSAEQAKLEEIAREERETTEAPPVADDAEPTPKKEGRFASFLRKRRATLIFTGLVAVGAVGAVTIFRSPNVSDTQTPVASAPAEPKPTPTTPVVATPVVVAPVDAGSPANPKLDASVRKGRLVYCKIDVEEKAGDPGPMLYANCRGGERGKVTDGIKRNDNGIVTGTVLRINKEVIGTHVFPACIAPLPDFDSKTGIPNFTELNCNE